jgi:hypothetical protein
MLSSTDLCVHWSVLVHLYGDGTAQVSILYVEFTVLMVVRGSILSTVWWSISNVWVTCPLILFGKVTQFGIDFDPDWSDSSKRPRNDDLASQFNIFTWSLWWFFISMMIILLFSSINQLLRFSMIRNLLNAKADNDLIRSSAIISLMSKYLRVIFFRFIISLIQCQRISMCFVLLWYSELMMRSISLTVGLGFGQKFKPDPRVDVRPGWTDQSSQPDPRVDVRRVLPSLYETSYI